MKIINKKYKDIKSFTIKRSIWARGNIARNTNALLNPDHTMCCLGQYAKACGIDSNMLYDVGTPQGVTIVSKNRAWYCNLYQLDFLNIDWESKLLNKMNLKYWSAQYKDSTIADKLIQINDHEKISEIERENSLKTEFAKIGVKVKFVD